MTLEEAIIHCEEKACGNTQCALEHRQLAEWLQELQQYHKNARKKEADRVNTWVPKFKVGDYITDMSTIYLVRKVDEDGYWCAMCDDDCNPKVGKVWCDSRVEKDLKLYKREPEKEQTTEISSTKEAEEIINFIKDCFGKLKQNFHGYCVDINWKYYEAALEVLRPEYNSCQQGFNAGHEEGYLSRKRVEKKIVEEIKRCMDELKDVNIDKEE